MEIMTNAIDMQLSVASQPKQKAVKKDLTGQWYPIIMT